MKKVEIHFHYPILPFSLLFPNNKRNANGRQKDAKMMAKEQQKEIAKRMIAHQNSSLAPFCHTCFKSTKLPFTRICKLPIRLVCQIRPYSCCL